MALNEELVTQLVKATNDRGRGNSDYTVYATVTDSSSPDRVYIKLDGSEVDTPAESIVKTGDGDRVVVEVKNHTATVTGNITNQSIGVREQDGLRSEISQTAGQIQLLVEDKVSGLQSSITQNANSITSVVKTQEGFSQFKQTVEGFLFEDSDGVVKIDGGNVDLTGAIKFSDLSDASSIQTKINNASNNASTALSTAKSAASDAEDAIDAIDGFSITEDGTTYIDGEMIYSKSIYTNALHLGGELTVYKTENGNTVGGYIGYCNGYSATGIGVMNSSSTGQCICTSGGARLSFGNSSHIVASEDGATLDGSEWVQFKIGNKVYAFLDTSSFRTHTKSIDLGTSSYKWGTVYATTCTGTTSDANKKNTIEDLPDKYLTLFDSLEPKRFKLNEGSSGRYHVGYIAQDVETAMDKAGIDSQEFGGFIKDKDEEGNDIYMLRYGEFDAIYAAKIKQIEELYSSKIEQLEARIAELEKSKI